MNMLTDGAMCARMRIAGTDSEGPTGELRIRAERVGGRTAVVESYRTVPFHLGQPSDRAGKGSAEIIIQGVGPGYLPGDRLAISIEVGPGASLTVRGQGATRLYPSPRGLPATATVTLTVREGGRLVYLPGELIPFRQSVLDQVTRIDVARGASLVLGEILTPGRIAMGEVSQFTRLHLAVEARYEGRLCLIERARLDPTRRPLTSVGRHGEHPVAGTLYLVGDRCPVPPAPAIPETISWASAASDGYTLVRMLGPTVQVVAAAMQAMIG